MALIKLLFANNNQFYFLACFQLFWSEIRGLEKATSSRVSHGMNLIWKARARSGLNLPPGSSMFFYFFIQISCVNLSNLNSFVRSNIFLTMVSCPVVLLSSGYCNLFLLIPNSIFYFFIYLFIEGVSKWIVEQSKPRSGTLLGRNDTGRSPARMLFTNIYKTCILYFKVYCHWNVEELYDVNHFQEMCCSNF